MTAAALEFPHLASRGAYVDFCEGRGLDPHLQVPHYRPDYMKHLWPKLNKNRILELGSCTGGNLLMLAQMWNWVTGVECSHHLVQKFYGHLRKWPLFVRQRVRMIEGMIEDLDLPDRFEWILLTETLEHVMDPIPILQVARRHVDPRGKMFVTAPGVLIGAPTHVRGVPPEDLEAWLGETGWRTTEMFVNPVGLGCAEVYPQTLCFAEAV